MKNEILQASLFDKIKMISAHKTFISNSGKKFKARTSNYQSYISFPHFLIGAKGSKNVKESLWLHMIDRNPSKIKIYVN